MAGMSKYLALAVFDMTLNPVKSSFTPPAGIWLALHTGAPSDSTYGNEASFTGYARRALNSLTAVPQAQDANGNVDILVSNGASVTFPASTYVSQQTVTHWAIWDSPNAGEGNILYSGSLPNGRVVSTGDSVIVPEGSLTLTLK